MLFMQIAWLLAVLFVGGMQHAAAEETRFNFAHDQASVVLAPGVTAEASSGLPPDSELINVLRGGRRILGIYAGNQPDNSVTKNNPSSKETIAGFTALTYRVSSKKGRSRQTFVQVKDEGWPNVIHFFYNGVTDEEAGIADKMIESLQLNGAATSQK